GLGEGVHDSTVTVRSTTPGVAPLIIPARLTIDNTSPFAHLFSFYNAGSHFNGAVSGGGAFVYYGDRFGPSALARGALGPDGKLLTSVADTEILFDGVPAPIICVVNGAVSGLAPFSVTGKSSTNVEIVYKGKKSPAVTIPVVDAIPSIFSADGSGYGNVAGLN